MIRGLTIAIACSVACAYGRLGASDDSAPKAIVRALPGSDGRLLAWTVGDKDFGAVQPARVLL